MTVVVPKVALVFIGVGLGRECAPPALCRETLILSKRLGGGRMRQVAVEISS